MLSVGNPFSRSQVVQLRYLLCMPCNATEVCITIIYCVSLVSECTLTESYQSIRQHGCHVV